MFKVWHPQDMNATFAQAFNSREIDRLLALYEPNAVLRTQADTAHDHRGHASIVEALAPLLAVPGTMTSDNNFCLRVGDLALLRADWVLRSPQGQVLAQGSSAEVLRRQDDGSWCYLIDHAAALSAPRLAP